MHTVASGCTPRTALINNKCPQFVSAIFPVHPAPLHHPPQQSRLVLSKGQCKARELMQLLLVIGQSWCECTCWCGCSAPSWEQGASGPPSAHTAMSDTLPGHTTWVTPVTHTADAATPCC